MMVERNRIMCEATNSPLYLTEGTLNRSTKNIGYMAMLSNTALHLEFACQQFTAAQYICKKVQCKKCENEDYRAKLAMYFFVKISTCCLELGSSFLTIRIPRSVEHKEYYIVFGCFQQSIIQFSLIEIFDPCWTCEKWFRRWNSTSVVLTVRARITWLTPGLH